MRSRLVVYNLSPERLRPILADIAIGLDPKARWAGDSLHLPTLDVQLHLDGTSWLSNSQLIAIGDRQRIESWRMIEKELRSQLANIKTRVCRYRRGVDCGSDRLGHGCVHLDGLPTRNRARGSGRDAKAVSSPFADTWQPRTEINASSSP